MSEMLISPAEQIEALGKEIKRTMDCVRAALRTLASLNNTRIERLTQIERVYFPEEVDEK